MARAHDWWLYAIAFLLFRLFDITKPWPISPVKGLRRLGRYDGRRAGGTCRRASLVCRHAIGLV
jgi:hypothetical protein